RAARASRREALASAGLRASAEPARAGADAAPEPPADAARHQLAPTRFRSALGGQSPGRVPHHPRKGGSMSGSTRTSRAWLLVVALAVLVLAFPAVVRAAVI